LTPHPSCIVNGRAGQDVECVVTVSTPNLAGARVGHGTGEIKNVILIVAVEEAAVIKCTSDIKNICSVLSPYPSGIFNN
jgi:hypothetical protein